MRAREIDGKFTSIEDFAKRVATGRFNKKAWESLIKSGGFDSLGDRSDLLFNLETIQAFASKLQKEALSGQTDLFGGMSGIENIQPTMSMSPSPIKYSDRERLAWERELMGLYISAHPLDNYDAYFNEQTVPLMQIDSNFDGKSVIVGGLISKVRTIVTKKGSKMAFIGIEDKTGESEVVVFPNLYENKSSQLVLDAVVRITGKINGRDRNGNVETDAKIIADDIQFITDQELNEYKSTGQKMTKPINIQKVQVTRIMTAVPMKNINLKILYVHIKDPDDHSALLLLKKVCSDYAGENDIVLVLGADKKSAIKLPFKVDLGDNLINELAKILGKENIVVK